MKSFDHPLKKAAVLLAHLLLAAIMIATGGDLEAWVITYLAILSALLVQLHIVRFPADVDRVREKSSILLGTGLAALLGSIVYRVFFP